MNTTPETTDVDLDSITVWDHEYLAQMMGDDATVAEATEMVRILRDRGYLTGPNTGPWALAYIDETDWNAMVTHAVDDAERLPTWY